MSVTIAPNDAKILYLPYNWHSTGARAMANTYGAYLRSAFLGAPETLKFDIAGLGAEPP